MVMDKVSKTGLVTFLDDGQMTATLAEFRTPAARRVDARLEYSGSLGAKRKCSVVF